MLWILTLVAVALVYSAVVLGVATSARVLSWIPSTSVRRWILVGPVAVTWIAFASLTFLFWVVAPIWAATAEEILDVYHKTPSLTILLTPPAFAFCVSVLVVSIRGFRAQPDVAYQPRAAAWPLGRVFVRMAAMVVLFLFTVFLQDVELRWRLNNAKQAAEATAAAMTPADVPAEDNAAIHYQRCADAFEGVESQLDFDEYKAAMTRLIEEGIDDGTLEMYFQPYEPLLEHLRRGTECDKCRFADTYHALDGEDDDRTRHALFWASTNMHLFGRYRANVQQSGDALAVIRRVRKLVDHWVMEPRSQSSRYYWAIEYWNRQTVEHVVTYCAILPDAETRATMAPPLPVDAICQDGARWSAAVMQKTIADGHDGTKSPESLLWNIEPAQSEFGRTFARVKNRFLWARDDLIALKNTYPFLGDSSLLGSSGDLAHWEVVPRGLYADIVNPYDVDRRWAVEAELNRRLSNIGLAAGLCRQRTGVWPSDLADLRKDCLATDLVDPVTGLAFIVAKIRDGLMIHSPEIDWSRTPFRDNQDGWDWATRADYEQRHTLFLGRAHTELKAAESRRQ